MSAFRAEQGGLRCQRGGLSGEDASEEEIDRVNKVPLLFLLAAVETEVGQPGGQDLDQRQEVLCCQLHIVDVEGAEAGVTTQQVHHLLLTSSPAQGIGAEGELGKSVRFIASDFV